MVALSFDAWKPGAVQPATLEVPVDVIEAVESAQLRATLKGHEDNVWQVAWAPDGKTLASLSTVNGEVKLWGVAERKELATLRSELGNSYRLAITPDSKTLVVGHHKNDAKAGPTGGIELWDIESRQRKSLLQHTTPRGVARLAIAPDGKTIAAVEGWREGEKGVHKSCVTLWDISESRIKSSFADESTSAVVFSPDGNVFGKVGLHCQDNKIVAIEVRLRPSKPGFGTVAKSRQHESIELPGVFRRTVGSVAGADYIGNVILWEVESAKVRAILKQEDRRRVISLAFAPDGKTLATAVGNRPGTEREPGLIVLWDMTTGQRRLTLTGHTNEVLSVAFSPDGNLLASGSGDRTVRLWHMNAVASTRRGNDGK